MKTIEISKDTWYITENHGGSWPSVMLFYTPTHGCMLELAESEKYFGQERAGYMCREYLRFLESHRAVTYKELVNAPEVL